MTNYEKLKAFIENKRKQEKEENKRIIERQIEEEIAYKETIMDFNSKYGKLSPID